MFTVYVIQSKSGRIYTGQTDDMPKRLRQHNDGICFSTRRDSGWRLVYAEMYITRRDAIKRERWLKTGVGREFLKRQLSQSSGS